MPQALRRLLYRLFVSPFVAGETYEEALQAIRELTRSGFDVTLDILGEDIINEAAAKAATTAYIETLEVLAQENLRDVNISIKLTMLGLLIDEDIAQENLRRLLVVAKRLNAFVRVDMEDPNVRLGSAEESLTEVTLRIVRSLLAEYVDHVGVVLQAYLHRTPKDLRRMVNLNCRIRLCKGAYSCTEDIALTDRMAIVQQYQRLATYLAKSARLPAFATHDEQCITWVEGCGRGATSFEFQMLYGIRSERARALLAEGYRVRIYVPMGTSWLPYFRRRLKEGNARLLLWMLARNIFKK